MHFTGGEWSEYNNAVSFFNSGTCTVSQTVSTLSSPFTVAHINPAPLTSSLSGTVTYGITPAGQTTKLVSNVSITATGDSFASVNANPDGSYLLESLIQGGSYAVTPSKTGNVNGITSFDATLVLRYIAAGASGGLTANQYIAADANSSGTITPFDATQILRYVAASGQTSSTGVVGSWRFTPAVRNYTSLSDSLSNENYEAILIGEVNGSWTPPAATAAQCADEASCP
jgi:hypothetical protein